MKYRDKNSRMATLENLAGSLMLISFGLAILAYLIAIDRPEWFTIRPVSGTAAAMSNVAQPPSEIDATETATNILKVGSIAGVHRQDNDGTN